MNNQYLVRHANGAETILILVDDTADPLAEAKRHTSGTTNGGVIDVRAITKAEADAIRAARPKPEAHSEAANVLANLTSLTEVVERQENQIRALEARLDSVTGGG